MSASLSYFIVEKPALRLKNSIAWWRRSRPPKAAGPVRARRRRRGRLKRPLRRPPPGRGLRWNGLRRGGLIGGLPGLAGPLIFSLRRRSRHLQPAPAGPSSSPDGAEDERTRTATTMASAASRQMASQVKLLATGKWAGQLMSGTNLWSGLSSGHDHVREDDEAEGSEHENHPDAIQKEPQQEHGTDGQPGQWGNDRRRDEPAQDGNPGGPVPRRPATPAAQGIRQSRGCMSGSNARAPGPGHPTARRRRPPTRPIGSGAHCAASSASVPLFPLARRARRRAKRRDTVPAG